MSAIQTSNDTIPRRDRLARSGMGALRVTLLFGSGAIALALVLVPIMERQGRERAVAFGHPGVDLMSTGSVAPRGESYTLRRSVLQESPSAVCVIGVDGQRSGSC